MDRQEIQEKLGLSHRENFRSNYLKPALEQGFIEMTIPNKPNSNLQKYQLTVLGGTSGKNEQSLISISTDRKSTRLNHHRSEEHTSELQSQIGRAHV